MASIFESAATLTGQTLRYAQFVARNFPGFYAVAVLTLVVLALEYAATSLMIPLAPSQSDGALLTLLWSDFAAFVGLEPSTRTWLWLFIVVMMVRLLLGYVHTVATTWLGKRVHETLSEKVFSQVLVKEPMERVYTRSVGHYITMAGDDTFKSGTIVTSMLQSAVGLSTAIVGLAVLYQFSASVFWVVVAFLLFCAVAIGALLRRVVRTNNQAVNLSRELGTTFVEALNSLRSIRSLHSEQFVLKTYGAQIHSYMRMLVEIDAVKTGVKAFPAIVLLLLAAIVLRPGAVVAMSDAALFAATIIVIRVFASLGQLVTAGAQLLTDLRAVKDISALVDIAQRDVSSTEAAEASAINLVRLKNVSFGYGDRTKIIDSLNFEFRSGRSYAIVGPSGVGKSTLADLLLGLSEPSQGEIILNDGEKKICSGRTRLMLVEQQSKIFSTTVRENLLLGAQASDADLYRALDTVSLGDMVRSLERGLDTRLSYLGENFSGGQRQRLGIARALIRNPDVLILDEATSALDSTTRQIVIKNIRERLRNGIIIFITHDEDLAQLADEVLQIRAMET